MFLFKNHAWGFSKVFTDLLSTVSCRTLFVSAENTCHTKCIYIFILGGTVPFRSAVKNIIKQHLIYNLFEMLLCSLCFHLRGLTVISPYPFPPVTPAKQTSGNTFPHLFSEISYLPYRCLSASGFLKCTFVVSQGWTVVMSKNTGSSSSSSPTPVKAASGAIIFPLFIPTH